MDDTGDDGDNRYLQKKKEGIERGSLRLLR
jgi:hypothetical protein